MFFSPSSLPRSLRFFPAASLCRQCLSHTHYVPFRSVSFLSRNIAANGSPVTRQLRQFSFTPRAPSVTHVTAARAKSSPLSGLADSIAAETGKKSKKSWFPETSDKVVGYWLLGSAGLVFSIVVLGGLTRLTESGLSITEWKPVTGTLPPMSQADWEENFAKYRDSPEYRILNPHMTLEEFKFIYYMEWSHRLLGRVIGLSFVLPAIYFTARRRVSALVARRIAGISALIGFQGFIGWWMVKSGLRDDLFAEPGSHPRVSQYRLTAHLGAAFLVYSSMLWTGLGILQEHRLLQDPSRGLTLLQQLSAKQLRPFKGVVAALALLTFTTAMTGGLVAGLDAGLIYNEFPWMGLSWHPPKKEMMDHFYSHTPDHSDLVWRNLLENPSTVQFQHRMMALTTFSAIVAAFIYSRRGQVGKLLPKSAKVGATGMLHLATMQVLLGITTLIYMVPTPLAAAHQAGSLALLTGAIVLGNRVHMPRATLARLAKRLQQKTRSGKGVQQARAQASKWPKASDLKAGRLGR